MIKNIFTPLLIAALFFTTSMTSDNSFPSIACTDLHNKTVELPKAIKGKMSIVLLAASKKTEEDLQSWMLPIYNQFITDNTSNMFATETYDVNTYFIPVFSGVAKAAANTIKKKLLNGLDPSLQSHVLVYKGNANKLFDELDLNKKELAVLILDKEGKIVKKITGSYSDGKMEQIEASLTK
jgi:hypothetical protein